MLFLVLLPAAIALACSNAQVLNLRDTTSECTGDLCDGGPSHSTSQTTGGAAPTSSFVGGTWLKKSGAWHKQSAVITLAVVLSVVVLGAIGIAIWWQCMRRRGRRYAGPQPYIDPDVDAAPVVGPDGIIVDAAPPYALCPADPFLVVKGPPLAGSRAEGGNSVGGAAEKKVTRIILPHYRSEPGAI
ncbi:hypothetical protein B0H16DRAFT_324088 [Mycena metata]|uniref:Uncharacterized protein n=1 Tax=Mycena metata TaxID=1033252 RepID=A0AAD7HN33_9AGAR|nr:hypothetical protein B0H16DRAFT_324088 [Mycena metata]